MAFGWTDVVCFLSVDFLVNVDSRLSELSRWLNFREFPTLDPSNPNSDVATYLGPSDMSFGVEPVLVRPGGTDYSNGLRIHVDCWFLKFWARLHSEATRASSLLWVYILGYGGSEWQFYLSLRWGTVSWRNCFVRETRVHTSATARMKMIISMTYLKIIMMES